MNDTSRIDRGLARSPIAFSATDAQQNLQQTRGLRVQTSGAMMKNKQETKIKIDPGNLFPFPILWILFFHFMK
jgi:hypothetical protein